MNAFLAIFYYQSIQRKPKLHIKTILTLSISKGHVRSSWGRSNDTSKINLGVPNDLHVSKNVRKKLSHVYAARSVVCSEE